MSRITVPIGPQHPLLKEPLSVMLTVEGERVVDSRIGNGSYYRSERVFGKFGRSFALPAMIRTDSIKAGFKNGVLRISIPKPEEEKPRQVTINVE